ncbi:MAG TPA: hypothetical protein VGI46_11380 [Candidatus Acidoferrum sp.]
MTEKPEPDDFEVKVRTPGRAFLRHVPNPSPKQFSKNSYWQKCLPQLNAAYGGVCAYSACWLPMESSVDHFVPKTVDKNLAYEWSNYRLSSLRLNSYKGDRTDVLDPFHVLRGWFVLNLTNFLIEPSTGLEPQIETEVRNTIETLRLNRDDILVNLRFKIVKDYAKGLVNFDFLTTYYPFIASELDRQNQKEAIKAAFSA